MTVQTVGERHPAARNPMKRITRRIIASGLAVVLTAGSMFISNSNAIAESAQMQAVPVIQAVPVPAVSAAGTQLTSFDQKLISLVNAKRKAAGLVQLKEAKGLTKLSVWWSSQLAGGKTGYALQHNPNATTMLDDFGASNWTSWSENVARWKPSSVTAQAIFDAYWASPGHKANILGKASRYIGMGSVSGSAGWTFNTMTFTDKVESGQVVTAAVPKPKAKGNVDKATLSGKNVKVVGWAYSPNKPSKTSSVRITVTGPKGATTYKRSTTVTRADVNKAYGISGKHGFSTSIPLQMGSNKVCVVSVAFAGATDTSLGCYTKKRTA